MDNIEFFKKLKELNETAWSVEPEPWNCICASYGLDVSESQNLYHKFQIIAGRSRGISAVLQKTSDKDINLIFEIADKAKDLYDVCRSKDIRLHGFHDDYKTVAVYWEKESKIGIEQHRKELKLNDPLSYVYISELVRDPSIKIKAVINQVDTIHSLTDYDGEEKRLNPDLTSLRVYDGDVFNCYNRDLSDYWNHPRDNGLYIADYGCYRKLLYTVGKGYLKKGKPNTDEDYEIDFGKNRFSEYIMTMSHNWRRIGNVNVDASFLLEKPQQKNKDADRTEGC